MNGTEDDDIFKEYNKDYNDLDIGVYSSWYSN